MEYKVIDVDVNGNELPEGSVLTVPAELSQTVANILAKGKEQSPCNGSQTTVAG